MAGGAAALLRFNAAGRVKIDGAWTHSRTCKASARNHCVVITRRRFVQAGQVETAFNANIGEEGVPHEYAFGSNSHRASALLIGNLDEAIAHTPQQTSNQIQFVWR